MFSVFDVCITAFLQCPMCTPVRTELFQQQQEIIRRQQQQEQAARAAAEYAATVAASKAASEAAAFKHKHPLKKRDYYEELMVPPGCAGQCAAAPRRVLYSGVCVGVGGWVGVVFLRREVTVRFFVC